MSNPPQPAFQERKDRCRIAEVLLYTCEVEPQANQPVQVHCFPIPRFFKLFVSPCMVDGYDTNYHNILRCPGHAALEITKVAKVDLVTGEVELPTLEKYCRCSSHCASPLYYFFLQGTGVCWKAVARDFPI